MANIFEKIVVPVADPDDARGTAEAIREYLTPDTEVVVAHVVPEDEAAPDEASARQREEFAERAYQPFREALSGEVASITPLTLYGRDVSETIVEGALEADATAIVYTPREVSRWVRLLAGSVSDDLLQNGRVPVLVLPSSEPED